MCAVKSQLRVRCLKLTSFEHVFVGSKHSGKLLWCFVYTCRRLIDLSNDCRYTCNRSSCGLPRDMLGSGLCVSYITNWRFCNRKWRFFSWKMIILGRPGDPDPEFCKVWSDSLHSDLLLHPMDLRAGGTWMSLLRSIIYAFWPRIARKLWKWLCIHIERSSAKPRVMATQTTSFHPK